MAETAETDGTLLNFVEVVAPHETFGRFCNRNRLSFDESVKIAPGEKLAMLCWSSQLAETKGIRSTYGYLITVRARILKTVAIGGGRMRCYSEMIPASACNFPQHKLQQIADILCGYYPPPDTVPQIIKDLIAVTEKTELEKLACAEPYITRTTADTFAAACDDLCLATSEGTALVIEFKSDSCSLVLAGDEKPFLRIDKPGPCSLVITDRCRMIWCNKDASALCIDFPFGEPVKCEKDYIYQCAQFVMESTDWQLGVNKFYQAVNPDD
jgi:hypothetical protein